MAKTSHTGVLPLLQRILSEDTSPLGMTFREVLNESGLERTQCSSGLHLLKLSGRCFSTGIHRDDRFFYATQERMDACAEAVAARLVEVRKQRQERDKLKQRAREQRRRANTQKAVPVKPASAKAAPKAKTAMPAPVTVRKTAAQRWAQAEPIIPPGVKVTVCPPCQPRTFTPPPFFRGEYLTEWRQLRGAAE